MFRTTVEAEGEIWIQQSYFKPPPTPPPSNLLLNAPKQYFCSGSSVLHVVMSVLIWSRAKWSLEKQLSI